jgi:hypothetical protein
MTSRDTVRTVHSGLELLQTDIVKPWQAEGKAFQLLPHFYGLSAVLRHSVVRL